jgi:hypothetical protein
LQTNLQKSNQEKAIQALQGQLELAATCDHFSQSSMAPSDWNVKHGFQQLCPPLSPMEDFTR